MNLLVNDFPTAVMVDDVVHDVNFDYKDCIEIMLIWEDAMLMPNEKANLTIDFLYVERPDNMQMALNQALKFLACGEDIDEKSSSTGQVKGKVYSFAKDSKHMYSAINDVLNGMLSDNKRVHWWLFMMAMGEISENSMLAKMIDLRVKKSKGKLSKEEMTVYHNLRDILELEIPEEKQLTNEESDNMSQFDRMLKAGNNGT